MEEYIQERFQLILKFIICLEMYCYQPCERLRNQVHLSNPSGHLERWIHSEMHGTNLRTNLDVILLIMPVDVPLLV